MCVCVCVSIWKNMFPWSKQDETLGIDGLRPETTFKTKIRFFGRWEVEKLEFCKENFLSCVYKIRKIDWLIEKPALWCNG